MKQAKTPKAYINVQDLGFAPIISEEDGKTTYGEPIQTRGLKTIGLPTGGELAVAWADGSPIESAVGDGEPTITLGLHQLPPEVEEMIFNVTFDEKGISREKWGHQPTPVAMWFKRTRQNGTFRMHGFQKVLFAPPEEETNAKEGTVEYGQLSIEGRVLRAEGSEDKHIKGDSAKTDDFKEDDFLSDVLGDSYTPDAPAGA